MTKPSFKNFFPIVVFFIALNAFFISGRHMLLRWHADQDVLVLGNLLLFIITLISFLLAKRGLNHSNPHVFIRAMYGSIMIKLFTCMIAAFVYISVYKSSLNKPALFTCMALYLVYTFMEVALLMKMLKQKKNA